ncbi:hypothetical protein H8E88_10470 [candidate division KSB1 bacterium]|nr:hypothetical protein [candidate division KSB1 bacterium]
MIRYSLKIIIKIIAIIILLCGFQIQSVFACKYNVRETGFVDLGSESYFINLYIDQNSPKEIISSFQQIASELLDDSNIKTQVININFERNNVAVKYLNVWNIKSLPAVLLVSPDGQSIFLPVDFQKQLFEQSFDKIVKDILFSPVKKHILKEVIRTYGVVLLIEGKSDADNNRAKVAVNRAIQNIQNKMVFLPKPIKHPPELVSVPNQLIKNEKILLWSLGIDSEQIEEPIVAVIYGRSRWIGPLFIGEKIISDNLSAILITIGLDCECGLDKSWMQGTMLPVKWDQQIQSRVAKNLGFDPENPMIKMEINRILRMGSSHPGVPMTIINEYLKPDSSKQNIGEPPSKEKNLDSSQSANSTDQVENSTLVLSLYLIFGLSILTFAIGLFIFIKKKNRNN